MNLDEELRTTLSEHADQAPPGTAMLAVVYERSHQLAVRRRYQVALVALVAVLALLVPVGLLHGTGGIEPLPPAHPTLAASPSPTTKRPAYGLWAEVTLKPAQQEITVAGFPFVAHWLPAGTALRSGFDTSGTWLEDRAKGLFIVSTGKRPYEFDWEAARVTDTTIGGAPAVLRTGADDSGVPDVLVGITWQLPGGGWMTVDSVQGLPESQVLRIAQNLAPGSTPGTESPFAFGLLPVDFQVTYLTSDTLCFSPSRPKSWKPPAHSLYGLCATVGPAGTVPPPGGVFEVLSGQAGLLFNDASGKRFVVGLQDGRVLTVMTSGIAPPHRAADADPDYGWVEISDATLGAFTQRITVA